MLHVHWLGLRLGVDGVHVEAEQPEAGLHLGGLVDVLLCVIGALGHLALHVDQLLLHSTMEGNIIES